MWFLVSRDAKEEGTDDPGAHNCQDRERQKSCSSQVSIPRYFGLRVSTASKISCELAANRRLTRLSLLLKVTIG